ncbi:MAG: hypothetical protein HZB37_10545 [Planctomycetes bacterium]|nr:hypothetical protein [Planctomycetota bacterium]
MSKSSDVYYAAKSSAIETQKTAKRSRILEILKKIEAAFLDAALNSNNHR